MDLKKNKALFIAISITVFFLVLAVILHHSVSSTPCTPPTFKTSLLKVLGDASSSAAGILLFVILTTLFIPKTWRTDLYNLRKNSFI